MSGQNSTFWDKIAKVDNLHVPDLPMLQFPQNLTQNKKSCYLSCNQKILRAIPLIWNQHWIWVFQKSGTDLQFAVSGLERKEPHGDDELLVALLHQHLQVHQTDFGLFDKGRHFRLEGLHIVRLGLTNNLRKKLEALISHNRSPLQIVAKVAVSGFFVRTHFTPFTFKLHFFRVQPLD